MATSDEKKQRRDPEWPKVCVPRLDRLKLIITRFERRRVRKLPQIPGFQIKADHFVRSQTSVTTYRRVRRLENPKSGTKAYLQYWPTHGWLDPLKITVVGCDKTGIPWPDLRTISQAFGDLPRITMVELALDFSPASGVDRHFLLAHARFGKSVVNKTNLYPGVLRYGTRKSARMVRAYAKRAVNAYRVELELHARWLCLPQSVYLLGNLPLGERDIQFVELDWPALESHVRRCRPGASKILFEARRRAGSLHRVLEYLRHTAGVNNPHRFLRRMLINEEIMCALNEWCASMRPARYRAERDKDWMEGEAENEEQKD